MRLDLIADCLDEGMRDLAGERTPETWAIRVAAYRLLRKGEPVALEDIARESGHDLVDVRGCLQGSSDLGEDGRVEAVMGLSLRPTQHRIVIEGVQLYTWCALDLLFIPPTLGVTAQIESVSPASDTTIRAVVTPQGIEEVDPAEAVVSVVPLRSDADEIRGSFCNFVHFFASEDESLQWQEEHPDGWVLPATDAYELGTLFVDRMGGDCCG